MSIRHWLAHRFGWNTGEVTTWYADGVLMVGFRCDGCGRVEGTCRVPQSLFSTAECATCGHRQSDHADGREYCRWDERQPDGALHWCGCTKFVPCAPPLPASYPVHPSEITDDEDADFRRFRDTTASEERRASRGRRPA